MSKPYSSLVEVERVLRCIVLEMFAIMVPIDSAPCLLVLCMLEVAVHTVVIPVVVAHASGQADRTLARLAEARARALPKRRRVQVHTCTYYVP